MKRTVLLKRVLFWLESSASLAIVLAGIAILLYVVVAGFISGEMATWMREIGAVVAYFYDPLIKIVFTEPLIVLVTLFWVSVYIGTMIYFAQTALEKRIRKYLIPLTLGSLPICAILGFTIAIAGLASQGAGG